MIEVTLYTFWLHLSYQVVRKYFLKFLYCQYCMDLIHKLYLGTE